LFAYKNGQNVGRVERLKTDGNFVYRNRFIYVDSDQILTGQYSLVGDNGIEYEYIYNENLKEGWNATLMTIYNDNNNKVTVRHEKGRELKGMEWIIW